MRWLAIFLCVSAPLRLLAEVPPNQTVTFTCDAPTNATGFKWYMIQGGPVTNFLFATATNTAAVSNLTPAAFRVFVTATNARGESDFSVPYIAPAFPSAPTNLRPVSTSLVVPLPGMVEGSTDLANWTTRLTLSLPTSNSLTLTHRLIPNEPVMFWRPRSFVAAAPPPLPQ